MNQMLPRKLNKIYTEWHTLSFAQDAPLSFSVISFRSTPRIKFILFNLRVSLTWKNETETKFYTKSISATLVNINSYMVTRK